MAENQFWGKYAAKASVPVASTAGLLKGAYDAARGNGTFRAGFEHAKQSVIEAAGKFGREKGDTIQEQLASHFQNAFDSELRPVIKEELKKRINEAVKKSRNRRIAR